MDPGQPLWVLQEAAVNPDRDFLRQAELHEGTLRTKAIESSRKISRNDFKELQVLMTLEPQSLSDEQRLRLFDLKELFDATMPPNTTRCRQPR